MSEQLALNARDIRKSFQIGERTIEVLHGTHLELRRGERLCLMGASGAGKSTFMHILGLLDQPTEGSVEVEGVNAWGLSVNERAKLRNQRIGFVFQFYHLLPELSAIENVVLPARIAASHGANKIDLKEINERAMEGLTRFGLSDRLTHRPSQLSGGEQQRVAIARALILDPPILIADEPTGNLDTATGKKVLDLLMEEQINRGLSMILVTHDTRLADTCDRVLTIEDGQIQSDSKFDIPH
ncbi:MAG: ABC transporter ATP-binding protein [Planctomycetota bacterium]|nr:ABC transporter ATP-binding protein [Planctomycetota bacterium]